MCLLDMQLILALLLIALRARMIIYLINVHCSHFLRTIYVWSSYSYRHISLLTSWSFFTYSIYVPCVLLVSELNEMLLLCASVSRYRCFWCKCFTTFRFRCEWVLPVFPNSRLSLEFVYGFCHGIAKERGCKVVISNYIVLALIPCQI